MASIVEKTIDGYVYKASEKRGLPSLDLLTVLFESTWSSAKEDTILHSDAANPGKAINKSESRNLLKRVAYTFRNDFGIGKSGPNEDIVVCVSQGHFLLPTLFYSTVAAGGIFSGTSPSATPKEMAGQIKQVDAKLVLCTADTEDVAVKAANLAGIPLSRVLMLGSGGTFELLEMEHRQTVSISTRMLQWERITDIETLANSTICILFSSGTTGLPKGVRLSHTNMVTAASLVLEPHKEYYRRVNPSFEYRTVAHLPAAHIAGAQGYFVNAAYWGGTVYWMTRFDFSKFLDYNKRHRISLFFSVPPIYLLIAKSPLVREHFDSLEYAISGAAPLGKDLQLAAQRKMGRGAMRLAQTLGLSETTGSIMALPQDMIDDTGSVGSLVSNCAARIVDDDGNCVQPGESGEIWVRGPVVTRGYYKNEKANKEAFIDGWFRTGDVGYFENGVFYIIDRKKELIKYKGLQVAPAELEALLVAHPKIQDAAVIGVQGEGTELPRAYIVADQNQISADEIIQWVNAQVSNAKRLRGGAVFLPEIPKSPAGKILRKELRALAAKERKSVSKL